MSQSELRIGALAAHAGVSIDTVRYYERQRLLPRAARSAGGFRLFAPEAVERIRSGHLFREGATVSHGRLRAAPGRRLLLGLLQEKKYHLPARGSVRD